MDSSIGDSFVGGYHTSKTYFFGNNHQLAEDKGNSTQP